MAAAMSAFEPPSEMVVKAISLPRKPDAPIHVSYVKSDAALDDTRLPTFVFLNGLGLPQLFWYPVISGIMQRRKSAGLTWPTMLAYDRFGQGQTTARDPQDEGKEDGYGHDAMDVVHDLKALLDAALSPLDQADRTVFFVANSIGCPLARMFSVEYPGTVCGMILLDTNPANSDFVSVFPDPDSPDFDESKLPEGVTPAILRETRAKFRKIFHPTVRNAEGFDRRNLARYLPHAGAPKLPASDGQLPLVIVVGHDPDFFAHETETGGMKVPRAVTQAYLNPNWHAYNQEMLNITEADRATGPIIAKNCGHFVQKDDPEFVAELAVKVLHGLQEKVTNT